MELAAEDDTDEVSEFDTISMAHGQTKLMKCT